MGQFMVNINLITSFLETELIELKRFICISQILTEVGFW